MRIAITGARGYLGSRLCAYLEQQGCSVIPLTHSKQSGISRFYNLREEISRDIFRDVEVLIHGAYDFSVYHWKDILRVNVEGSKQLFQAALSAGLKRIIVLSTMSAFSGCQSLYGRAKLLIEEEGRKVGALVVRPGLVYDPHASGMVGSLQAAVRKMPFIPVIGTGQQKLYLLHSEDLCCFISKVVNEQASLTANPITLAHEQGFTLFAILKIIAEFQGKVPLWMPIPAPLIFGAFRMAEFFGLHGRLRSDGVRSLMHCDPAPSFFEMHRMGFVPRSFSVEAIQEIVSL